MDDKNKIVELFKSGNYKLAYILSESLNINICSDDINLCDMTNKITMSGSRKECTILCNDSTVMEIDFRYDILYAITLLHEDHSFLEKVGIEKFEILNNVKYDYPPGGRVGRAASGFYKIITSTDWTGCPDVIDENKVLELIFKK